jgi:translation initiation factor 2 beta subunit (eIF-2beta)/eIF-5
VKTATDSDLLEILDRTQGDVSVDDALIAMRAVRDAARQEALREYGQHKEDCKTTKTHDPEDCGCGFVVVFPN